MKKSGKIILAAALGCIAVGIVTVISAFAIGGFDLGSFNVRIGPTGITTGNTGMGTASQKVYAIEKDFNSIDIRDVDADIRFVLTDDGRCEVAYPENETVRYNIGVEDGVLKVERLDRGTWEWNIIDFGSVGNESTVTVLLSRRGYDSLYLQTVSGDVKIPAAFSFDTASISSTSGDIELASMDISTADIASTSGDICLTGMTASSMKVATTSGEIELTAVTADNDLTLSTVSGEIDLERSDAENIIISTTSGNVEGTVLTPKEFETNTTSGEVSVPYSDPLGGVCKVTTVSGDIELRFAK